jgi:hypothetical protein
MVGASRIEWTDSTWNPVTGARKSVLAVRTATRTGWRDDYMLWGRRGTGTTSLLRYNRMYFTNRYGGITRGRSSSIR